MSSLLLATLLVFFIFVAPLWLILHYRSKSNAQIGLSLQEKEQMENLSQQALILQERVVSLEKILDETNINWREK